ncbi:O-methyltransferase 1, chloroplastic [Impatiens glandulifera]|uniref:O-methyltransferase 1, chloroplastic n=1 Tax=Impatiens glandulifera TaxID=253017 RepID=UPI001FB19DE1|nr:O-methyltransferase 1, chloroplastic [Impatiens glandulifera]
MACAQGISPTAVTCISRRRQPVYTGSNNRRQVHRFRAQLNQEGDDDSVFRLAALRASLRLQETHRPDPLFLDPYAGCFVSPESDKEIHLHQSCNYRLATKFIDDKLLTTVSKIDGVKQIVLLTDGIDTRPYRLNWPSSSIIYDISPDSIYSKAARKLQEVGAKVPRGSLFYHVPLESPNLVTSLHNKGFNGSQPSVWVLQGLPFVNLVNFADILSVVGHLATKGSLFLGELPVWLTKTESSTTRWMEKVFMGNSFSVDMINLNEFARSLGREEPAWVEYDYIHFVAQHLRFSDDQMEYWSREFQRIDGDGDEEGFEEL